MTDSPQSVILLSIDALRADHLGCYGYDRDTSPNLDMLAENNIQFTNSYSVSSHTREAVPALLSGQYPDSATDESYRRDAPTIASHLQGEGYLTAGFHSNPYVSRAFGFDDGFDKFDDDLHLGKHKLIALAQRALDKLRNRHYARASEVNERSLSWIDSLGKDQQFFLWNHYMDPHGPYEPLEEYREIFHDVSISDKAAQKLYKRAIKNPDSITAEERQTLINLYDAEIRYTDQHIRRFLDELDKRGLLADSLVIITADHGDLFGEHGYYEHPRYPFRELVEVPMIIMSGSGLSESIEDPVSTIDIVPTILDALNIRTNSLPGSTLIPTADGFSEIESRTHQYCQASTTKSNSLYRRFAIINESEWEMVEFEVSDGEVAESSDHSEVSDDLYSHARDRIDKRMGTESQNNETTDEVNSRLEALGYK
ncbi:sulfatase [Haloferax larsenii]|uniref:Sulfatase n=1 Tax=Haloferax larsenii TaxID=302484 RepID=A0ABY5REH0_HALLR|nr:sulfatase [Haloferax larsenii]UVE50741.1 sulfatase [Haloferax larsenii]